jgi:hypothetical protein
VAAARHSLAQRCPTADIAPKYFTLYSATYALLPTARTWARAEAVCELLGNGSQFKLATVYSADHANLINAEVRKYSSLISSTAPYWIGASKAAGAASWGWVDTLGNLGADGKGPGWTGWNPWASGQPDGGSAANNCVAVGGGSSSALWGDAPCTTSYPYVCVLPGELAELAPTHTRPPTWQSSAAVPLHQAAALALEPLSPPCAGSGSASYSLLSNTTIQPNALIVVRANGALDGYCLTAPASGTAILLRSCRHTQPQIFTYTNNGLLKHVATGLCVTVQGAATALGSQVALAACAIVEAGAQHQQWNLDDQAALRPVHIQYTQYGGCLFLDTTTATATLQNCSHASGITSWRAGKANAQRLLWLSRHWHSCTYRCYICSQIPPSCASRIGQENECTQCWPSLLSKKQRRAILQKPFATSMHSWRLTPGPRSAKSLCMASLMAARLSTTWPWECAAMRPIMRSDWRWLSVSPLFNAGPTMTRLQSRLSG